MEHSTLTGAGHLQRPNQQGFSLIEVLVAMLITVIGSLGMIALQLRAQQSQLESQQRSQGILLAEDMLNRLRANPFGAVERTCYTTDTSGDYGVTYFGTGIDAAVYNCSAAGVFSDQAEADVITWDSMLKGATETLSGSNVGGLIDARGCITTALDGNGDRVFRVTVTWQGQSDMSPPADPCAANLYNADGADTRRRAVFLETHFGSNTSS